MYIQSKLKEENTILYELNIQDETNNEEDISYSEVSYAKKDVITVQGEIHHTAGFCIIETSFDVRNSCTDLLIKSGNYVQISLLLTGSVATFKASLNKVKDLKAGVLQLVFRPECKAAMEISGSKGPLRYIRVFLSRSFYLVLLKNENWISKSIFYQNVENGRYVDFGENLIPVTPSFLETLSDILQNNYTGLVKKYYIEHKLKYLFLQLYIDGEIGKNISCMEDDVSVKLESARAYLITHYFNPPTIKELSRIVSLNEFKLKAGFREKFDSTIHDYVTQIRMRKAKKMLLENQTVNEVSAHLGYKGVSHFITSFKKKYGITPKQALQAKFFNS